MKAEGLCSRGSILGEVSAPWPKPRLVWKREGEGK